MDLDSRFADFVREKRLPYFDGIDAFENKFIIPSFIPFLSSEHVVKAQDSASYFGSYRIVADTDHFSIAKPTSLRHPSHQLLWEFSETRFKKITSALQAPNGGGSIKVDVDDRARSDHKLGAPNVQQLFCICKADQTYCFVKKQDCQKIQPGKECSLKYSTKTAFNVNDNNKWSTYNNLGWTASTCLVHD